MMRPPVHLGSVVRLPPGAPASPPPHACPVRITLLPEELEALYRGDSRTFVTVAGTNNCGQAIQVEVRRRDPSELRGVGEAEAPYSELPPFSEYTPSEE